MPAACSRCRRVYVDHGQQGCLRRTDGHGTITTQAGDCHDSAQNPCTHLSLVHIFVCGLEMVVGKDLVQVWRGGGLAVA